MCTQMMLGFAEYYRDVSRATGEMVSSVQAVDRSAIQSHPPVITPAERSSATHAQTPTITTTTTYTHTTTATPAPSNTVTMSGGGGGGAGLYPATTPAYQQQTTTTTATTYASTPTASYSSAPVHKPVPTPPARGGGGGKKARGLFDFVAQEPNELSFKFNDVIIIHTQNGDWWEGELNGRRGLLPSNYVQLLTE